MNNEIINIQGKLNNELISLDQMITLWTELNMIQSVSPGSGVDQPSLDFYGNRLDQFKNVVTGEISVESIKDILVKIKDSIIKILKKIKDFIVNLFKRFSSILDLYMHRLNDRFDVVMKGNIDYDKLRIVKIKSLKRQTLVSMLRSIDKIMQTAYDDIPTAAVELNIIGITINNEGRYIGLDHYEFPEDRASDIYSLGYTNITSIQEAVYTIRNTVANFKKYKDDINKIIVLQIKKVALTNNNDDAREELKKAQNMSTLSQLLIPKIAKLISLVNRIVKRIPMEAK